MLALNQLPGGVPKAYLRVLSFNQDSVLVDQRTVQLTAAALGNYETLSMGQLIVQQDGYVSVYVGNESATDVYFDDVTIEHRQGLQVQENHYDPFGLDLAGVNATAPGLKPLNQYKFNGKEFQTDLGLNWNHQDWRFYDTQLGRWHVVDPEIENAQESWTPYSFGFDNAVRFADADGRNPGGGDGAAALAVPALIAAAEVAGEVLVVGAAVVSSPVVLTVAAVAAVAVGVVALGYGASVLVDHLPAMSPGFRIGAHNAAIYGSIYGVGDGNPGIYNASSGKRPANRTADRENGNSKASEKQQHGYKIKNNETNQTEEFGISGQKLKKDGTSPRVDQKLAQKYNNDPKYSGEVVKPKIQGGGGQTARERALDWEQGKVNSHSRSPSNPQPNAQNGPPNQILPKPKM